MKTKEWIDNRLIYTGRCHEDDLEPLTLGNLQEFSKYLLRDFIRLRKTGKASDRLTAKKLLKELFDES